MSADEPGAGILLPREEGRGLVADVLEVLLKAGDGGRKEEEEGVVKILDWGLF